MSATTDIYVTPRTSLILIRNVSTPTNIYLSTFFAPNFQVSIRDTTGSSTIQFSTVTLSTIDSARFIDGSFSYTINQPYGFVNLGFRNSSFWQVLHTSGQVPATAAADVGRLNVSTSYVTLLSTLSKNVSSLLVENLTTTNAIVINSPFIITNLSAPGVVTVQSTFNVYGDVLLDKQLFVSAATYFQSSLTVRDIQPISSGIRVLSSVGVAGTLSVGGLLTVGSTLHSLSTNSVLTLQVQKSTTDTVVSIGSDLQIQNILSTLLSLTVTNSFVSPKPITILQNVSSLTSTMSTQSLSIGGELFTKQGLSTQTATFLGGLNVVSSLEVLGNITVSTGLTVKGNFLLSSLSTASLSSLSSFSTGSLRVLGTAFLSSGLSTLSLNVLNSLSVGNIFQTVATVSSLSTTRIKDTLFVRGNSLFDFVNVDTNLNTNHLDVEGKTTVGDSAFFRSSVSTLLDVSATDLATVYGDVGVGNSMFVQSNMTVIQGSKISSFFVNSFLLSNLHILTSSPFTSFTASTLITSNVASKAFVIDEGPPAIFAGSTFASTTQLTRAIAENSRFNTAVTSNLQWGASTFPGVKVSLDVQSLFPRGLSAQTVKVNSMLANFISSRFIGDGIGLSNVAMPYAFLSGISALASTVSSSVLFTSSIFSSTFQTTFEMNVLSSFQSPTLLIQAIGFSTQSTKNQIVVLNSNLYVVNNTVFIDTLRNRVGVNISSPQVDLDVSGGFYAGGSLVYSSINPMVVSTTTSRLNLSSIYTNYAFLRDALRVQQPQGIQFVNRNIGSNGTLIQSFFIQERPLPSLPSFGIFSYPSSIGLLRDLFIVNDTQRVGLNTSSPLYEFSLTNNINSGNGYFSSVHSFGAFESDTFTSPSLLINPVANLSINTLSSGVNKLYLDVNLMTLVTGSIPRVGIKQINPGGNVTQATLDITGNAFFSTIDIRTSIAANTIRLGSVEL